VTAVSEPDQPYCGVELLPHAKDRDGLAAPIVCDLPPHGREAMHRNLERGTYWRWQAPAEGAP
jgi:hypothetical protein